MPENRIDNAILGIECPSCKTLVITEYRNTRVAQATPCSCGELIRVADDTPVKCVQITRGRMAA